MHTQTHSRTHPSSSTMAAQLASTARQTVRLTVLAPIAKAQALSVDPDMTYIPLPRAASEEGTAPQGEVDPAPRATTRNNKSFKFHIGGVLNIPTPDARALPHHAQPSAAEHATATLTDPFEGLPFAALAERFGGQVLPALQAAREEKRRGTRESRAAAAAAAAAPPPVPHFLPFTRWAAHNESFRATFVDVDDPKLRKKARLSWYHPDDTMVPRDWFQGGLLADLKYFSPFGLFANAAQAPAPAQ